jgi:putative phosphotransacetylase
MKIPIEISARHAHFTCEHLETLFGPGFKLKPLKDLSQPGQFAAEETVAIEGPRGRIEKVRVMGPCRDHSQVEVSKTDARVLGIEPPLRVSSDIIDSAPIKVIGPAGTLDLPHGAIIAQRHIHLDPGTAEKLGFAHRHHARVRIGGERALVYDNVVVRVDPNFSPAVHLDTDEGNAAGISAENSEGEIILA